jgi:hypothetical protein
MPDIKQIWETHDMPSTRALHNILDRSGWDISWSQTVHQLRDSLGMDISTYRRMRTGAVDVPDDAPSLAIVDHLSPSYAAMESMITQDTQTWQREKERLSKLSRWVKLFDKGDEHYPYQDNAAIEVAAAICQDFAPDVITDWSDLWDMSEFGRWEDANTAFQHIWGGDVRNLINTYAGNRAIWRDAAPNAVSLALPGNHDMRIFRALRTGAKNVADYTLDYFVRDIRQHGSLWFGWSEYYIELSPGLVVLHGYHATKNIMTTIKNTMQRFGFQRSVVANHVHREGYYNMHGLDHDIQGWVSGCLCQLQPHYSPAPQDWNHGIVLGYYDPVSWHCALYNVRIMQIGSYYEAHWGDKAYRERLPGSVFAMPERLEDAA